MAEQKAVVLEIIQLKVAITVATVTEGAVVMSKEESVAAALAETAAAAKLK